MNVNEMMRYFRLYVDDPKGDRWEPDDILDLLNAGQEEVAEAINAADERYFMKCVSYAVLETDDSLEFDLPTDHVKTILFERVVSGGRPIPGDPVDFVNRNEWALDPVVEVSTSGVQEKPRYYHRANKLGVVWPRSDYTARLHYTYKLPTLTTVASTSEVPAQYHKLIALAAARLAYAQEGRDWRAVRWSDVYTEWVGRLQVFIERRNKQRPRYVHASPW